MTTEKSEKYLYTNVRIFYEIAKESLDAMNESLKSHQRAKPGNEPGYIFEYDPDRTSFKQALIAIMFSSACLESLLHHIIVQRKGVEEYERIDRYIYKDKLKKIGCKDATILELSDRLRHVRKEIVHEKAHMDDGKTTLAQGEARFAVDLLDRVLAYFGLRLD